MTTEINNRKDDFADILQVEGINYKGYGDIYQYVMLDRELSLEAKGIYAYFCSYAGSGNSTLPGRDKILNNMKIGKSAYYNHFPTLVENGYIKVEKVNNSNGKFKNNNYTIVSNPKKLQENPILIKDKSTGSIIMSTGIKAGGYGSILKAVMIDDRLCLKSKALYAYLASLTRKGESSFPKRDFMTYHLKISNDLYHKLLKKLVDLNYITTVQRHLNGRFSCNDYHINQTPDIKLINKPSKNKKLLTDDETTK